ncbi:MAG: SDR family oxidoreductase [Anaerolineae bacterium]
MTVRGDGARERPIPVLLTGGTGLIGWELLHRMPRPWHVTVIRHRNTLPPLPKHRHIIDADLTCRDQVRAAVEAVRPEVVVHTASLGSLDACERDPDAAWRLNVDATRFLLECARPFQPFVVFCSTIYVFDGRRPPYREDDPPHPINVYGRTKLAAEELAQDLASDLMIVRPNTAYGWHLPGQRQNWVTWLLGRLRNGQAVQVVDDVINNYIWAGDVARAIIAGIVSRRTGLYHLGGPEALSRYEFSLRIASTFGFSPDLISPASSEMFPSLAPRPRDTTCTIDRMIGDLGVSPLDVHRGLLAMKAQMPEASEAM